MQPLTTIDVSTKIKMPDPSESYMFIVGMPTRQQLDICLRTNKLAYIVLFAPYTEPNHKLKIDPLAATAVRVAKFLKLWVSESPKRKGFLMYTCVNLIGYYRTVNNRQVVIDQLKENLNKVPRWEAPAGFNRGSVSPVLESKLTHNINQVKEI